MSMKKNCLSNIQIMQIFKTEPNNSAHYRRLGEKETNSHSMREHINTRSHNGQYNYQHTKIVTLETHLY